MKRLTKFLNKKGIVSEYLPWVIIAVAVLVILMIAIFFMRSKGTSIIDGLKNLFGGL